MTITRTIAVAILAAASLAACSASGPAEPATFDGQHVGANVFSASLEQDGVVIIDVRTPGEYAQGHIEGAVLMNVQGADFVDQVAALDPDGEYAVYCRSGNRSRAAMATMANMGVLNTLGLDGGISSWTSGGFPITTQ